MNIIWRLDYPNKRGKNSEFYGPIPSSRRKKFSVNIIKYLLCSSSIAYTDDWMEPYLYAIIKVKNTRLFIKPD